LQEEVAKMSERIKPDLGGKSYLPEKYRNIIQRDNTRNTVCALNISPHCHTSFLCKYILYI
jgi:hypothetical protein